MSPASEPVTLVLPVRNAADRVAKAVTDWSAALKKTGREFALVVVDDGSTDGTPAAVESLQPKHPNLTLLKHDAPHGFGACLRTALPACTHPLFAYSALDYPYTPADIGPLLTRVGETADVFGDQKPIIAVSGARSGPPIPGFWKAVRIAYRVAGRVLLGVSLTPARGWYGPRAVFRSWAVYLLMGGPLQDVDSAFKVIRRDWLDRFPIQSDGDFVHAEIIAKLTFLTALMDELPLTPKPDPIPPTRWADFPRVFRDGRFHPALPDVRTPPPVTPAPDPAPAS